MGLFDINIKRKMKIDTKDYFFEFIKKNLTKNKEYETKIEKNCLTIDKCHLHSLLKYNTNIEIIENKQEKEVVINAQLHDTLILAILVILAILLTYGFGVVFVVAFTYLQKRKATKYLETLLKDYETIT